MEGVFSGRPRKRKPHAKSARTPFSAFARQLGFFFFFDRTTPRFVRSCSSSSEEPERFLAPGGPIDGPGASSFFFTRPRLGPAVVRRVPRRRGLKWGRPGCSSRPGLPPPATPRPWEKLRPTDGRQRAEAGAGEPAARVPWQDGGRARASLFSPPYRELFPTEKFSTKTLLRPGSAFAPGPFPARSPPSPGTGVSGILFPADGFVPAGWRSPLGTNGVRQPTLWRDSRCRSSSGFPRSGFCGSPSGFQQNSEKRGEGRSV